MPAPSQSLEEPDDEGCSASHTKSSIIAARVLIFQPDVSCELSGKASDTSYLGDLELLHIFERQEIADPA